MPGELSAIVVAPRDRGPVITGLTLAERGRRVAVRAGVAAAHVHIVRAPEQIAAVAKLVSGRAIVVIHARAQVVAAELVEPLQLDAPGARKAVDARGDAGAIRVDAADASTRFFRALDERVVGRGLVNEWNDSAVQQMIDEQDYALWPVDVGAWFCAEIDTPADLADVDRHIRSRR